MKIFNSPSFRTCIIFLLLANQHAFASHHLVDLANDILPDDIVSANLGSGDDANFYYLIRIPESGVLRAYTQSTIDTLGELLLTDGDDPVLVADNGAEAGNFLIETRLTAGEYLIRVLGKTPFETGTFNLVTEFTGDSESPDETDTNQYSEREQLSLIITAGGGKAGSTQLSIGSFLDGDATLRTAFSSGDSIVVNGTIEADSADLGKAAELFMVLRSNLNTWSYRDLDGIFRSWNVSLKKLEPAYSVESLSATENIELYSGTLAVGDHRIFIGYSLVEGGPLIFNGKAYRFTVSE